MRILLAQINPTIGDLSGNSTKILAALEKGRKLSADLVVFPELCLTGYSPEDLLLMPHFIKAVEEHFQRLLPATKGLTAFIGLPRDASSHSQTEKGIWNSAAIVTDGKLVGYYDKMLLPTYDVFDERRYFEPGKEPRIWDIQGKRVGILICEDIWQHSERLTSTFYRKDPIDFYLEACPDVLVNLSASPFSLNKPKIRWGVCAKAAKTLNCPVFLCNQVGGNDSLLFDGNSVGVDAKGRLCARGKGFEEDWVLVDTDHLSPISDDWEGEEDQDLHDALILGIRDYFTKLGFKKACLGLSGGIDSALVAYLATKALGKENVLAVGMPSRYSSEDSIKDAKQLAKTLGIAWKEIPIEGPFSAYLELLGPHFTSKGPDVTEENLQARIRGMILMAFSNKLGYIVLSTGNKSELGMGYSTLYGDMCGGLGVISDLTKEEVYRLARWINRHGEIIPQNTIDRPPSAELRPNQKDSDSLPEYPIVDTVLKEYVEEHLAPKEIADKHGFNEQLVLDLVERIHKNEYKRRQSAPGLRISGKSFSVGRHFPIVQSWKNT